MPSEQESDGSRHVPFWKAWGITGVTPKSIAQTLPTAYCEATDASIKVYANHPRQETDGNEFVVTDVLVALPYAQLRVTAGGGGWSLKGARPHDPDERYPYSSGLLSSAWRELGGETGLGTRFVEVAWANHRNQMFTYSDGGLRHNVE